MSDLAEKLPRSREESKKIVDENHTYKKRVRELDKELVQTRSAAQKSVKIQDKQLHLKEKIEKILHGLEAVEVKKGDPE